MLLFHPYGPRSFFCCGWGWVGGFLSRVEVDHVAVFLPWLLDFQALAQTRSLANVGLNSASAFSYIPSRDLACSLVQLAGYSK